jgi:hypothetical protein
LVCVLVTVFVDSRVRKARKEQRHREREEDREGVRQAADEANLPVAPPPSFLRDSKRGS